MDYAQPHTAKQIEGHVIVCGLKGVGLRTVEQLHFSGVQVVVVDEDPDPKLARIVEGWGVEQIHRNANLGDGLSEAGLDRAVAVVCAEANDLATLELALQVHEARPDVRLVVQLANPSVGRALETVTGANSVLAVATLAAPSFVEACLGLATHELKLAGEKFAVVQATVSGDEGYNQTFRSHFGNLAPVAISQRTVATSSSAPVAMNRSLLVTELPSSGRPLNSSDLTSTSSGRCAWPRHQPRSS